jgi:hypothetical protein
MAIILKPKAEEVIAPEAQKTTVLRERIAPAKQPEPEKRNLSRNFVIERKSVKGVASGDTALVVNGKQKSIGRKSHYLLDMLTLDDE